MPAERDEARVLTAQEMEDDVLHFTKQAVRAYRNWCANSDPYSVDDHFRYHRYMHQRIELEQAKNRLLARGKWPVCERCARMQDVPLEGPLYRFECKHCINVYGRVVLDSLFEE